MQIKILRFIDKYIFWILIFFLFLLKYLFVWNKKNIVKNPKKILVIRLWALWSSLLTFNMIKKLKEHYIEIEEIGLICSTRNRNVYKNQWYFDNIYNIFSFKDLIKIFLSFKKYDVVIDAEDYFKISTVISIWVWKINIWYSNIKSRWIWYIIWVIYKDNQHALITFLDLLTPLWVSVPHPYSMEKFIYKKEKLWVVDKILKWSEKSYKICLHTWWAETSPERFWDLDNWVKLISKILDNKQNIKIFLSWTTFEKESINFILNNLDEKYKKNIVDLWWLFNLDQFAYFLENINLMISNDTWAMHLSASIWIKTIWLFGPNLPERFWPYPPEKNIAIYKWNWIPYINVHISEFKKCSKKIINRINVEDIYNKIFL